jgi:LytR cell envelope-related transcriptional attenuator
MSSPESPSSTRPLRVAGLALLGLAAIALIVGLIAIFGGGDGDDTAKPPPTTATSGPGSSGEQPPSSSATSTTKPPESSSGAPTTTTTRPTGTSGTAPAPPPGGDGNGEPGKSQPVRVYNNSTVSGLGEQAADDLRAVGWNVISVGNYPYGTIPTSSVYFRPGTAEQQAAEDIADDFGMKVQPRFTGLNTFPDGVIVIVTKDYQGIGGSNEGK